MFEWPTVTLGIALGALFGCVHRRADRRLILAAIAAAAFAATIASGEAERSWAYFAIDILQTAIAFGFAFFGVLWLQRRSSRA